MATETTKYPFLLQNDTNNFVLNNQTHTLNNGRQYKDYDFNYLFTSKLINPQKIIANENASERASLSAINLFDKSNENYEKEQEAAAVKKAEEIAPAAQSLITLINDYTIPSINKENSKNIVNKREVNQKEFSKRFTQENKDIIKSILESQVFQSELTKNGFKEKFRGLLNKLGDEDEDKLKILTEIILSLPESTKKIYINDKDSLNLETITSLYKNDNKPMEDSV
jgi:hypothetical protein